MLFGNIQDRSNGKRHIRLEMQRVLRVVPCIGNESIEFAVLIFRDTAFFLCPKRFDRVYCVAVQIDRKADKADSERETQSNMVPSIQLRYHLL